MKIFTAGKQFGPKNFTTRIMLYTVLCAAVTLVTTIMGSFIAAFVQTEPLAVATVITFIIIIIGFSFVSSIRRMIQKSTTTFYMQDNKLYYVDVIKQMKLKPGIFTLLTHVTKLKKEQDKVSQSGNKLPANARHIQHVEEIREKVFTYEIACKINYNGRLFYKTFTLVKGYNNEEELVNKLYKLSDPNFNPGDHKFHKLYLLIPMVGCIFACLACIGCVGLSMPGVEILGHAFFLPMVVCSIMSIPFAIFYAVRYFKAK